MGRNKAFFLDRDGVMIEEKNYLADPANVCLCPGCAEALRKIAAAGYRMIVTSNRCRMRGITVRIIRKGRWRNMRVSANAGSRGRECCCRRRKSWICVFPRAE